MKLKLKAKRGVEFRHSTRNASRIGRQNNYRFPTIQPTLLCVYSVKLKKYDNNLLGLISIVRNKWKLLFQKLYRVSLSVYLCCCLTGNLNIQVTVNDDCGFNLTRANKPFSFFHSGKPKCNIKVRSSHIVWYKDGKIESLYTRFPLPTCYLK